VWRFLNWSDLKRKLAKEGYSQLYDKIVQLKFTAADEKYYDTDCANTETIRLEAEAKLFVQEKIHNGAIGLVWSFI
jgi:hypothetical protein